MLALFLSFSSQICLVCLDRLDLTLCFFVKITPACTCLASVHRQTANQLQNRWQPSNVEAKRARSYVSDMRNAQETSCAISGCVQCVFASGDSALASCG